MPCEGTPMKISGMYIMDTDTGYMPLMCLRKVNTGKRKLSKHKNKHPVRT